MPDATERKILLLCTFVSACLSLAPLEVVSARVVAVGRIARPELAAVGKRGEPAPRTRRPVYFAELAGFTHCPIYDRYSLGDGARISGPAIVQELDSTTVVHPGYTALVDRHGNLLMTRENQRLG